MFRPGKHANLTNREGEDRNPVYAPDGNSVYFLSERNGGSFNVYNFTLNTPQEVKAHHHFPHASGTFLVNQR